MNTQQLPKLAALLLGAAVALPASVTAQGLVNDFSNFPGSAGNGWTSGWTLTKAPANASFDASNAVIGNADSAPFTPAGNYYATYTQSQIAETGKLAAASLWRGYGSTDGFDHTATHTVSFSIRLDAGSVDFNHSGSVINFYGYADATASPTPFRLQNTWYIRLNNTSKAWEFYNGSQNNDYSDTNWVDSGITAALGEIYQFSLTLNPEAGTWQATLKDGSVAWTSELLGYQSDKKYGRSINFASTLGAGDEVGFSLGEVQVIPEPSSIVSLLVGAGLLHGTRRWYKLRR